MLRWNSLGTAVLIFLNQYGRTVRKNLFIPFSQEYDYRYFARTVQSLIKKGYIAITREKALNYVDITANGKKVLFSLLPDEKGYTAPRPANKQEKNRLSLVSDTMCLCRGCGFQINEYEKVNLLDLYENHASEEIRERFLDSLENGVFYSMREIRTAYRSIHGTDEIANWTRLIGILLHRKNLIFIYSVGGKLVKWMSTCELKTTRFIADFLLDSDIISHLLDKTSAPICVVCGKGYSMIPKIITGRRWGKYEPDKKFIENSRKYLAKDHINSHNLGKVFGVAYYIPVDTKGVPMLQFASLLDEQRKNAMCSDWFKKNAEWAHRTITAPYHQGSTLTGETVFFMPYMDLIELEYYKRQGKECHAIIQEGMQDAVSRVMGPLLLSAQTVNREPLSFNRYDKNGAFLDMAVDEYNNDDDEEGDEDDDLDCGS